MTDQRINEIVEEIHTELSNPFSSYGSITAIGLGENAFENHFIINNDEQNISTLTYLLDDIEDGLSIMQQFSGEKRRTAQEAKQKFGFNEQKPIYLHYIKKVIGQ